MSCPPIKDLIFEKIGVVVMPPVLFGVDIRPLAFRSHVDVEGRTGACIEHFGACAVLWHVKLLAIVWDWEAIEAVYDATASVNKP